MANRQRAEARRKAAAKAAKGGSSSKLWMWVALGVVAAIVVVGAIVALGGDDDSSAGPGSGGTDATSQSTEASGGTDATDGGDGELTPNTNADGSAPDSQPVAIEGESLPIYDSAAALDAALGTKAPVITGFNFEGEKMVIDAAADGPTMIVFLAHWCSHCNAEVPVLIDWNTLGGVPDDLNVIGVATAVSSKAPNYPPADWFDAKGWPWPAMVDTKVSDNQEAGLVAQAFGASAWPYMVIVGEDGLVKLRISGEHSADELTQMVEAALAA